MTVKIKAVVFDQGGVLSLGGEKGTNEKTATRAMGLSKTIEVPELLEDLKCGRITNAKFVDLVNAAYPDAPKRLTVGMWDTVYASLKPEAASYAFAKRCREADLRVALLSNINEGMARRLRADGSYKGFDPIVLSCDVKCAKPDPRIYAKVEAGLRGIKPAEILLLDDQDKCVVGARKRGWQALKVESPSQMVRDASRLLGFN